jgi:ribosome assembly protein 3
MSNPGKNEDFEAYYLQRATKELAEDLEKVRNAQDFKPESVQILVDALRQGASTVPPADQERVVNAGSSNDQPSGQGEN